jgi:hypothetical protein
MHANLAVASITMSYSTYIKLRNSSCAQVNGRGQPSTDRRGALSIAKPSAIQTLVQSLAEKPNGDKNVGYLSISVNIHMHAPILDSVVDTAPGGEP